MFMLRQEQGWRSELGNVVLQICTTVEKLDGCDVLAAG